MPFWAMLLEGSFYILFPMTFYYYVRFVLENRRFDRTFSITENAGSFGRVDELRSINRELARVGKHLGRILVVLMIVLALYTYLWVVPHSRGEI